MGILFRNYAISKRLNTRTNVKYTHSRYDGVIQKQLYIYNNFQRDKLHHSFEYIEGLEHKSDMSKFSDFEISVLHNSFLSKFSLCTKMITLLH